MAKFCQTSSNSWLISRYYLRYFPCLTAIYLIFITIFEMKTRPKESKGSLIKKAKTYFLSLSPFFDNINRELLSIDFISDKHS